MQCINIGNQPEQIRAALFGVGINAFFPFQKGRVVAVRSVFLDRKSVV